MCIRDSTHFLGSDIESIAAEKVGIIKPGAAVVTADQSPEVMDLIDERCAEVGARRYIAEVDFALSAREVALGGQVISLRGLADRYDDLFVPLHGLSLIHI